MDAEDSVRGKMVVILAGYEQQMNELMEINPGWMLSSQQLVHCLHMFKSINRLCKLHPVHAYEQPYRWIACMLAINHLTDLQVHSFFSFC